MSMAPPNLVFDRGDYFLFGSVFIKKVTKPKFFFKKTKTGSNRLVSVRFGFLRQKPVWLGFFQFGFVFFRFFFGLSLIRFFRFQAYKTEPIGFFKILIGLIGFFSRFGFFKFFLVFLVF
jgi:hypothetical protein